MKKMIIVAAVALLLGSCASTKNDKAASVVGEWAITEAMQAPTAGSDEPTVITFTAAGDVNGCAGVNRFFGKYNVSDGKISFSNVGSTMKMGQSMDTEAAVLKAINEAATVEVGTSEAELKDADGKTLMKLARKP